MHNVKYDYSSVHVDVPSPISDDIIRWGKQNIADDDIFCSQRDPTFGRENEIHITILYGLHAEYSDEIRSLLQNKGPVKIKLDKIGIFTNPYNFDVIMIEVIGT